mmetsp:Transcript_29058/g.112965  ORF Transcript_29058/g.112965 Transcript_29058/m.112965 type:complete len:113 (-) Transcript_29058:468-806(-)
MLETRTRDTIQPNSQRETAEKKYVVISTPTYLDMSNASFALMECCIAGPCDTFAEPYCGCVGALLHNDVEGIHVDKRDKLEKGTAPNHLIAIRCLNKNLSFPPYGPEEAQVW